MKSQQYYELVRKYEREARENPSRFHRRLSRHLLLGYVCTVSVLLLLIAASIGCGVMTYFYPSLVTFVATAFALVITWNLLSAVFAKVAPLEGTRLEPQLYPQLFAEMNELREAMDIPEIEEVILTADLNACAGEHRSRIWFGKKHRYVGIGLPLLEALSADEFRTILAHEIAHLARGHGRLLATFWHLRTVWSTFHSDGNATFWWRWFAKYFGSRFEAMNAVVSHEFEFEADRIAHAVTDSRSIIASRLKMELLGRFADQQQSQWFNAQVLASAKVPTNVVSTYCQRLQRNLDRSESENLLLRILAEETSIYLTHPSCRDRIAVAGFPSDRPLVEMVETAMGYLQPLPSDNAQIASFYYLGTHRDALLKQADENSASNLKGMWEYRTEFIRDSKTNLQQTAERIKKASESDKKPVESDLVSRAHVVSDIFPRESARQAWEDVLEHYPENASALYYTGYDAYQYEYDLATAEDRLARAIEADPRLEFDVSSFMVAICREQEKPEEAEQWHQHGFGAYDALQDSADERATVTLKDKLIPATLTDDQVQTIKSQIETIKNRKHIKRVWVACKKLQFYPEKPLFVLAVETNVSMFRFCTVEFFNLIGDEFANSINFGEQYFVVVIQGENRKFKKKIKKLKPTLFIDIDDG